MKELFDKLKIKVPKDQEKLFMIALTHTSYLNENPKEKHDDYNRLEFLGDSIIGKITTEYIYKHHPNFDSGKLSLMRSKIVSMTALAKIAKQLKIEKYCLLGRGEKLTQMSDSMYSDFFESLIGAIYLALGEKETQRVLLDFLLLGVEKIKEEELKDFKTKLQESLQSKKKNELKYESRNISKTSEKPFFEASVIYEGIQLGKGKGSTKKEAEQEAAKEAYNKVSK